jgi:monooxygenase
MSAPDVIIIGAGVTGLSAAYYLRGAGLSYTILEADADLGGVWHTHRWHGARCDSDFVKYSFSFKPFLSDRCLQTREQIHRYLRSIATEFHIMEHIRFATRVTRAVFDDAEQRWIVHTSQGTFTSQFLINGNGYFSEPYVPRFRDSEKFKGEIIHAAALDDRRTFTDKDVVLVGSGSTAVCAAPELAPPVSRSLTLLQRSPTYIYEISNAAGRLTRLCQMLHTRGITVPLRALRYYLQCRDDVIFVGFRRFPRVARWFFRRHWIDAVGKERFEAHFRPRYNPWEQRIAVAIGLKEKLRTNAITIKTGEVERFTESSIRLTNGEEVRCDVCILATGFDLDILKFELFVGDTRIAIPGINFYKGIMLGGVPNYFHPFGAWHTAWTQRSETVMKYAIQIIAYMKRRGFGAVSIARRDVAFTPPITPGYITRSLSMMPRFYGTYDLPSIDNLVSYRFDPRRFSFSSRPTYPFSSRTLNAGTGR